MQSKCFDLNFLVHLFHGHIRNKQKERQTKPRPKASGFHYEGVGMYAQRARILENHRSGADKNGVYTACVAITSNGLTGYKQTSCFPRCWTRLQVLAAIKEVYEMRPTHKYIPVWGARSSSGLYIYMRISKDGSIEYAFPKREKIRRHCRKCNRKVLLRKQCECGALPFQDNQSRFNEVTNYV